jgi:hypothetical protein
MRLTGIDSLQRGITNLLANWELVLVNLAQNFTVSVLMVAGLVPIVLAVGVGPLRALIEFDLEHGRLPAEAMEQLTATILDSSGQLLLAALVGTVVWSVGLLVLAYFQAGTFGVLADAEHRAPLPTSKRKDFRLFSLSRFRVWADTFMWRFFWIINLFIALAMVPLLIFGAFAILALWLASAGSVGGAVTIGCLGVVGVVALSFIFSLWWQLAMAAAVAGSSSFWLSIRQGSSVLWRRFGAVLVLVLLAMVVAISMAIVFVPLGIVIEVAARDSVWAYIVSQVVMTFVQSLLSAVLSIAFSGALVALVNGEISVREASAT